MLNELLDLIALSAHLRDVAGVQLRGDVARREHPPRVDESARARQLVAGVLDVEGHGGGKLLRESDIALIIAIVADDDRLRRHPRERDETREQCGPFAHGYSFLRTPYSSRRENKKAARRPPFCVSVKTEANCT